MELSVKFRSLEQWLDYRSKNADLFIFDQFDRWGLDIFKNGCREPISNIRIPPGSLQNIQSWREGLVFRGVSSRIRAVMLQIEDIINDQRLASPRIFAAESLTPFALRMRGIFPRFWGSEFTLDPKQREWMYPIPFEDLQALTLRSNSFDVVSTNEVLEHVPSIDKSLSEIYRVLKPGGYHAGTVPFAFFEHRSIVRARLNEHGGIDHILDPEYHGDPMNEGGVLVFETPGWDIIDRAKAAGFSDAYMNFVISKENGILSEHVGGVFVFCCIK